MASLPTDQITRYTPVGRITKLFTGSAFTSLLYSGYNFSITTGANASNNATGSPSLDVSNYITKSIYGFLHTTQSVIGALVVSGSIDGTNWFLFRSGSFSSGSLNWFTITDAVPKIQAFLFVNAITGSSASGSLYISCQQ